MASTVISPPELEELPPERIARKLTEYMPDWSKAMDRQAGSLVGDLEKVIEHELWRHAGYDSMEAYTRDCLDHSAAWASEVVRIYNEEWNVEQRATGTVGELNEAEEKARKLREEGASFRQIEKETGIPKSTAHDKLSGDPRTDQRKTRPNRVQLNPGTRPKQAAEWIRERLGDDFAERLKEHL